MIEETNNSVAMTYDDSEMFSFKKDEKVKKLDLVQLQESKDLSMRTREVRSTRPMKSSKLIETISGILNENGLVHKVDDIYVPKRYSSPVLNDAESKTYPGDAAPLNLWLFERVICKILIPSETDHHSSIAINYTEKGIQVGYGINVDICNNMCILGHGQSLYSTYSSSNYSEKKQLDDILLHVEKWAEEHEQNFSLAQQMVSKMIQAGFSGDVDQQRYDLFGRLQELAVIKQNKGELAPFDTYQNNEFIRKFMDNPSSIRTIWDVYMVGTSILKPENDVNFINVLDCNARFGKFLYDRYLSRN